MELRLPLEMSPGREAACRAVLEHGVFSERRTEKLPLRVDFIHAINLGKLNRQGHRLVRCRRVDRLIADNKRALRR